MLFRSAADTDADSPAATDQGELEPPASESAETDTGAAGEKPSEGSETKSPSAGDNETGSATKSESAGQTGSESKKQAEGNETTSKPANQKSQPKEELMDVPLGLPPVPVPDDNPMTAAKIALGKKLYFDKRLSGDGTISCATCHDPQMAWTEHRATSEGIDGQVGDKNSPTVINSAYAPEQFWDGRAASLEEQAVGPVENPIEMGHDMHAVVTELSKVAEYEEAFQEVFGTSVTQDGIAKAIAAYERTVLSGNSPYDQYQDGDEDALTEAQQRGMKLFQDVGCATCHSPPVFSNYGYYNAGIGMDKDPPPAGRKNVTGEDGDLGKFRVPMLREVANTHPYYHDGSVETLEEAVSIMADGGKDNDNLSAIFRGLASQEISEKDQQDIVEFLKTLSGDYPIPSDPFEEG